MYIGNYTPASLKLKNHLPSELIKRGTDPREPETYGNYVVVDFIVNTTLRLVRSVHESRQRKENNEILHTRSTHTHTLRLLYTAINWRTTITQYGYHIRYTRDTTNTSLLDSVVFSDASSSQVWTYLHTPLSRTYMLYVCVCVYNYRQLLIIVECTSLYYYITFLCPYVFFVRVFELVWNACNNNSRFIITYTHTNQSFYNALHLLKNK